MFIIDFYLYFKSVIRYNTIMFNFEFKTVDKSGKGLDTDKEDFYLEFIRMGVVKNLKKLLFLFQNMIRIQGSVKGK